MKSPRGVSSPMPFVREKFMSSPASSRDPIEEPQGNGRKLRGKSCSRDPRTRPERKKTVH
jgi:hypothetical protein